MKTKSDLNLVLTYACDFSCKHCICNAGPFRKEVMSYEKAVNYLDTAVSVLDLASVGYTGGEPFMVYPLLKDLMNYAYRKYGLSAGVVTNCGWCKSPQTAAQRIEELIECGLRSIVVSLDSFHLEFVSLESIKNVVDAALKYNLQITVNTVVTRNVQISKRDAKNLLSINDDFIESGRIEFKEFGPLRIGRAKRFLSPDEYIDTTDETHFNGNCPYIINTPAIAPDGNVYSCCCFGDAAKEPEQLVGYCGNSNMTPLRDILVAMDNNLLFNILKTSGPYAILKNLQNNNPNLTTRGRYLTNCDICVELYHNQEVKKALQSFLKSLSSKDRKEVKTCSK